MRGRVKESRQATGRDKRKQREEQMGRWRGRGRYVKLNTMKGRIRNETWIYIAWRHSDSWAETEIEHSRRQSFSHPDRRQAGTANREPAICSQN